MRLPALNYPIQLKFFSLLLHIWAANTIRIECRKPYKQKNKIIIQNINVLINVFKQSQI